MVGQLSNFTTSLYQLKEAIKSESQLESPLDKLKLSAGKPGGERWNLYALRKFVNVYLIIPSLSTYQVRNTNSVLTMVGFVNYTYLLTVLSPLKAPHFVDLSLKRQLEGISEEIKGSVRKSKVDTLPCVFFILFALLALREVKLDICISDFSSINFLELPLPYAVEASFPPSPKELPCGFVWGLETESI